MRYAHLTPEHQAQVIQQRLLELEGQHYQAELDRQRWLGMKSESDDDRAAIEAKATEIAARQEALDLAHAADATALEELKPKKLNAKAKT